MSKLKRKKAVRAVDKKVAGLMKRLRNCSGHTQQQVADHLGITFQQVQKYESGQNRISAGTLHSMCGLFGVDPGAFFNDLRG